MEEAKSRSGVPGDRAQIAAEKLRALRERANHALDEHRQRLVQIEAELSARVRQLAEEFETASAGADRHGGRDEELAALRQQLEEGRAKHDRFVDQLALARRQLDAIQTQPCAACQDAAQQLADAQGETSRLRDEAQAAERRREQESQRHAKLAEQIAAARQAISDLQSESHERAATLQEELDREHAARSDAEVLAAGLARDVDALHAECDALQTEVELLKRQRAASQDEERAAADAERLAQDAELKALQNELETAQRAFAALEARAESAQDQLAEARQQAAAAKQEREDAEAALAAAEAALAAQQTSAADAERTHRRQAAEAEAAIAALEQQAAAARSEKDALSATLSTNDADRAAACRELTDANAANATLTAELAVAVAERRALQESLDAAERQVAALEQVGGEVATLTIAVERAESATEVKSAQCADLTAALADAESALAELREATCSRAERDELQRRLDQALAEVVELNSQAAELRSELADCPEPQDDSAALATLQAERDALAEQVDELRRTPATPSHETEDLRRRCELAVDDVRQLKQENAQLREQIAKAKTSGGGGADHDGNNWAAQRARLMAMLENEEDDGPIDAARAKERASIADAIERTDRALAEKDREIAEARAALDGQAAAGDAGRTDARDALLDADELIASERQRLAELQTEWEQKLRSAELEFSVERAKLAREQSALKERLFDLQKLESQGGAGDSKEDKPRRRWRSALGLGDEGEGKPG